jgi:hypothetical protein
MSDVENEENTNQEMSVENEEVDNNDNQEENNEEQEQNNEEQEQNNEEQEEKKNEEQEDNEIQNVESKTLIKKPISKKHIPGRWDNLYDLVRILKFITNFTIN